MPLLKPHIALGDGVWICADALIGPGVKIGDCAIVAACAVVMRDVERGDRRWKSCPTCEAEGPA